MAQIKAMGDSQEEHRDRFGKGFVILLVVAISLVFVAMIWSFLQPLLLAAILSGMVRPVYVRLARLFRGRKALASGVTIVLVLVLVMGPLSAFLGIVAKQAIQFSQTAYPLLKEWTDESHMIQVENWVTEKLPMLDGMMPTRTELFQGLGKVAQSAGTYLAGSVSKMTAGTAAFFLNLFVMLYAMFFFLMSGRGVLNKILYFSPLPSEDEELMLERFASITRATIKGTMIIALIQGALGALGFWVAGIQGVAFWGTIMVVLSIIPGVGTVIVWVPAVIYLFIKGETLTAILLGAWFAGVVGTIDNVLRPKLVGQDAKMPDLLILLSTLGGIFMFGAAGFIIGPIIAGLFVTVWDIYGVTFKDSLPPVAIPAKGEDED
ncbi:MAG: AI-2E family transporter [Verrucomicrobiota bacterium]